MSHLIQDLIFASARRTPHGEALVYGPRRLDYATLAALVRASAATLLAQGLEAGERVAVYMEKNIENVAAMFGAASAGGVFVPVNPLLKPEQVAYILADCNVRVLVTTVDRLRLLQEALAIAATCAPCWQWAAARCPSCRACRCWPGTRRWRPPPAARRRTAP